MDDKEGKVVGELYFGTEESDVIAEQIEKEKKVRAIKVDINATSKVAHDLKLSYKGKDISAMVTEVSFFLMDDNISETVKDLLEGSSVDSTWFSFSKKEFFEHLEKVFKKWKQA